MTRLHCLARALGHERRGGVMIEFAFIVPILASLVMAGVEFANFVNLHQRIERVATTVGDFAARDDQVTAADLSNFFAAAQHIAAPEDLVGRGRVILSTVQGDDTNGPQVLWQQTAGGNLSVTSQVGTQGGNATLPANLTVDEGTTVLVTEVFFDYQPGLFANLFSQIQMYQRAFHRPRGTNVLTLAP